MIGPKILFLEKRKLLDVAGIKALSFNGIRRGLGMEFNLITHTALFAYGDEQCWLNYT